MPDAPLSIGPGLRALAVYLLVHQHIPVERCRQLIADVAGAEVSDGFIHSCLRKAASALRDVAKLIKTLITAAHVAGFDETTLRAGKAGTKKYVQGAFTGRYTALFLGERTLKSFRKFGILPEFAGVAVTDRYVNYWHSGWKHLAGHLYGSKSLPLSLTCGVTAGPVTCHAARSYSWISPPKTFRRRIFAVVRSVTAAVVMS